MNRNPVSILILLFIGLLAFTPILAASNASWSTPVNLTEWQHVSYKPWLLLAQEGTQAVFWKERDMANNQEALWARVRSPGGEWSTAQNIFGWREYVNYFPELDIAPDGTVWALLTDPDPNKPPDADNLLVRAASWSGDGFWKIEILSEHESAVRHMDLSIGPEGHLAATWVACASLYPDDQGPCAVNVRLRSPGTSAWEANIERADISAGAGILYGRSLVGPGGMTVTTWAESSLTTTGLWHVMANAYDPTTKTWDSSPVDISDGGVLPNMWPFLAQPVIGSDGTVIAAWYKQDHKDLLKASLYSTTRQSSTGYWNLPTQLSNIHDASLLSLPILAVGRNGTAVAAWEQQKSSSVYEFTINATVRDPMGTWGTNPVQMSDWMDGIDLAQPQVWPDGSIMLLWEAVDGSRDWTANETIFWSARSPKGNWGDVGQGQLGGWFYTTSGVSLAAADDGSMTAVWGVDDYSQPVNQRSKALAATWIPGAGTISVDTLTSGDGSVDVNQDGLVVSDDGQTKAAAWLTRKSATSPADLQYAVFYAEIESDNTAPTAAFTVDKTAGTTSDTFQFDASGCNDNEDPSSALEVRWDWEDDGTFDTGWGTTKTENHQYSVANTYQVRLQVRDTGGLIDSTTKVVTVTSIGGSTWSNFLFLPMTIR